MSILLLIAYLLCGVATVRLAMWISVAEDGETYFWGVLLWPLLLLAVAASLLRSLWSGRKVSHRSGRARKGAASWRAFAAGLLRFRMKRRFRNRR